ncbi:MAG TPA: DUF5667 domain-containing protein [Pseudonocardiaceae bacterium]|jgi:hypothetical protein|nr:DUF5667 domain-containing protein [Pseudonocardiaceae bacterium]
MSAGSSPSPWGRWRAGVRTRRTGRSPQERFARAVDADVEPAGPRDPKLAGELAVVSMLRRAAPAPATLGPDDAARARMRERITYGVATMEPEVTPLRRHLGRGRPSTPNTAANTAAKGAGGTRGRLMIAFGAAFCLVIALAGMALLVSQNALPGDALYGMRRTAESAALGLTVGTESKGDKHLEFAADRITDLQALAQRYPNPQGAPVGDYLTGFNDFDSDAAAGSADLTGFAASNAPQVLTTLADWAAGQQQRIAALRPALPAAAAGGAQQSSTLLGRIQQRANALLARTNCYTVTDGAADDIGVLPATGGCDRPPGQVAGSLVPTGAQPTGLIPAGTPVHSGAAGSDAANVPGETPTTQVSVPPTSRPSTPQSAPTSGGVAPPGPPVGGAPTGGIPTISIPLPLPLGTVPPLLPGLPVIKIGPS